ncbi:MAG: hypothetical protein HN380_06325 [Victivallales bacterium]|nr:hypothetical protein [Victivallales bacterium]
MTPRRWFPACSRTECWMSVLLALAFIGFALPRAWQTAGQDEILHYVRLGDDLYRHGLSQGDTLIVFSPHLYGFAIWLSHCVFGAGLVPARVPGMVAWVTALWLAYLWGRGRTRESRSGAGWPLLLLGVGCLLPLAVQGGTIVDIDNGFLVALLFLQCWTVDLLVERRDWRSWLGAALATTLALWGRLTTPTILIPLFVAYACFRGSWRTGLVVAGALLAGWLGLVATWGAYCVATSVHFSGPFLYLRDSLFFTTVGSRGASLRKVLFAGVYLWLWLGGGVLALFALATWWRFREWWREHDWRREDLFLGAGLFLLAGYSVVGGTLFGFPKYHCPAIPLILAGCAPILARGRELPARRAWFWLVGLMGAVLLVQYFLIGDPILTLRLDLRTAVVSPGIPVRPVLLRLAMRLLAGLLVLGIPLLIAWWRKAKLLPVLIAVALGMNVGLLLLQNTGGYQTGYNYGDKGDAHRVAEWLRERLAPDSQAMVPGEVVYLLDHPGVPHLQNDQWKHVPNLLRALELPRMRAAGISIITNDAEQYLTLIANPEIRAVLDREYTEHQLGNYVLFLRNRPDGEVSQP